MENLSTTVPFPPFYYKFFTDENVAKVRQKKKEHEASNSKEELKLEYPLNLLVPPEPPKEGRYSSYGSFWNVEEELVNLEELGIPIIYDQGQQNGKDQSTNPTSSETTVSNSNDGTKIRQLKKLKNSLLIQFLQLLACLSTDPAKFAPYTTNIQNLLINMHHLLNEYRPHQSREMLITLMKEEIERKNQEIQKIKKTNKEIHEKISNLAKRQQQQELQNGSVSRGGGGVAETGPGNNLQQNTTSADMNAKSKNSNSPQTQNETQTNAQDENENEEEIVAAVASKLTSKSIDLLSWSLVLD